jgi:hypothetical protein
MAFKKGNISRLRPTQPLLPPDLPQIIEKGKAKNDVEEIKNKIRLRNVALSQMLVNKSHFQAFDIQGTFFNPIATVPVTGNTVVGFTVPDGQVLKLTEIGIQYSDPFIGQTISLGWWLTVDESKVPYVDQVTPGLDFFYYSHHQMIQGTTLNPLWIQAGETVALQVYPVNGFDEQVTIMANMKGNLYQIGSGEDSGI